MTGADGADAEARGRRRLLAGAALLVVVAGVATAIAGSAGSDGASSGPAGPADLACDRPPAVAHLGAPGPGDGAGTLAPGAVEARLCRGSRRDVEGFSEPVDALDTGLDQLAAVVDDSPVVPADQTRRCFAVGGTAFRVLLAYPDGSTRVVHGNTGGCGDFRVGDARREGSATVLAAYVERLRAQRAAREPGAGADRPAPPCDATEGPSRLAERPLPLVRARLCVRSFDDPEAPPRAVGIPRADLRRLLADRDARLEPGEPSGCATGRDSLTIVGVTRWGDAGIIPGDSCGGLSSPVGPGQPALRWDPGPEARRILERLAGRAR